MPDLPPRGIIREHEFEEQLFALFGEVERADKFTAAAEDLLARLPKSGMPCEPTETIWYLPMSPVKNRRVSLYYSFDEKWVVFLAILAFDD
jgi:hypothetical protein